MPQSTPVQVPGLPPIEQIATGRDHVLALTRDGEVWGWGLNRSGQVGPEALGAPVLSPTKLMIQGAVGVYANGNQSFVLRRDGRLYGWGQNINGTLGISAEDDITAPEAPVFGLDEVQGVSIGALHGIARTAAGELFTWGWSFEGSLGGGEGTIDRWAYRVPILVGL